LTDSGAPDLVETVINPRAVIILNPPDLSVPGADTTEAPKKKGFFKGFWKRSRHYSLENQ
jgi:hypothetical protein